MVVALFGRERSMKSFAAVLRVLVGILVLILSTAAFAATTPASATLSPASSTVTYTGGPFAVSNPSSPLGETPPACAQDIPCSEFVLTISIPASDTKAYKARLSVGWSNSGTTTQGSGNSDYDVYVYSPDLTGTKVTQGPGNTNPELASFAVANGTYRIYVVPYDTSPTVPFSATVSL